MQFASNNFLGLHQKQFKEVHPSYLHDLEPVPVCLSRRKYSATIKATLPTHRLTLVSCTTSVCRSQGSLVVHSSKTTSRRASHPGIRNSETKKKKSSTTKENPASPRRGVANPILHSLGWNKGRLKGVKTKPKPFVPVPCRS
jgi:hypothetical protein